MTSRIETGTDKIRNGNIITGFVEAPASGGLVVPVRQLYWIRTLTGEPSVLDRLVKCEDQFLKDHLFSVIDILEGSFREIRFEGVFSPRELKKYFKDNGINLPVIDPRIDRRSAELLLQPVGSSMRFIQ